MLTGKEALMVVLPLPSCDTLPLWQAQASKFTLLCRSHLFRLFSRSQPWTSPWVWPLKPELHHSVPAQTDGGVSQAGRCRETVLAFCAGHSPFCLWQTSCCALLLGSEALPHPVLSPSWWGGLPRCRNLPSFTAPSWGRGPTLIPSLWRFSRLYGSLGASVSVR